MRKQSLSYGIHIPQPCPADWGAMQQSTMSARHCELCDHVVHDLASMTARQVDRLVAETDGHFCARVTQRADGSLVLQAAPQVASPAVGLLLAAALSPGAATTAPPPAGQCGDAVHASALPPSQALLQPAPAPAPPQQTATVGEVAMMGKIAPPERLAFVGGHVSLPKNVGVAYGTVTAVERRGRQWTAPVGKDGGYSLAVPAGSYTVSVSAQGTDGQHWMQTAVPLRVGKTDHLTQDLSPREPVFVTAGVPAYVPPKK